MSFKRKFSIYRYAFFDLIAASLSWLLFYLFRKVFVEHVPFSTELLADPKLHYGLPIVTLGWLILYLLSNTYQDVYKKSRILEIVRTAGQTVIGVLVLFFSLLLNDIIVAYGDYYTLLLGLMGIHFSVTVLFRIVNLSIVKHRLLRGKVSFNTLLIGGNQKATDLYKEISASKRRLGYSFKGFISIDSARENGLDQYIPRLGDLHDLPTIVEKENIEEVIIAIESSEHETINQILGYLNQSEVVIKIIPDIYDILSGAVRMGNVLDTALIEVHQELLSPWQIAIKRIMDVIVSVLVLTLGSPLFLYLALRVKLSSQGPVIYAQERIGLKGKAFLIYKFRSMQQGAEDDGPRLSSDDDPRITPFGKVMRKYRLDELPQFWNVLLGDMSLVGPRPERQHYIRKIVQEAPHYLRLQAVKPGITSWGMVRYGYASSVDQMLERMKYDLLYIENISIILDLRIMILTLLTLLQGKGK